MQYNKRWPIVYIEGPQVIFSEKMHSFTDGRFCLSKQCIDSDQMRIWVCTVCQNTDLGANSR